MVAPNVRRVKEFQKGEAFTADTLQETPLAFDPEIAWRLWTVRFCEWRGESLPFHEVGFSAHLRGRIGVET